MKRKTSHYRLIKTKVKVNTDGESFLFIYWECSCNKTKYISKKKIKEDPELWNLTSVFLNCHKCNKEGFYMFPSLQMNFNDRGENAPRCGTCGMRDIEATLASH
jgi:hypothetical protein